MDERQKKVFRAAISKVKLQYKTDRRNALPIRSITKLQIVFNLFWVGYNLYKFSTEDAKDGTNVIFNYIVMFFLLLMNLPLIGYRENKTVSVFLFFVLLFFLVFFATIGIFSFVHADNYTARNRYGGIVGFVIFCYWF